MLSLLVSETLCFSSSKVVIELSLSDSNCTDNIVPLKINVDFKLVDEVSRNVIMGMFQSTKRAYQFHCSFSTIT